MLQVYFHCHRVTTQLQLINIILLSICHRHVLFIPESEMHHNEVCLCMQKVLHLHRNCFLRIFYAPESVIILINLTTSHWNWSGFYSIVLYQPAHNKVQYVSMYLYVCQLVDYISFVSWSNWLVWENTEKRRITKGFISVVPDW